VIPYVVCFIYDLPDKIKNKKKTSPVLNYKGKTVWDEGLIYVPLLDTPIPIDYLYEDRRIYKLSRGIKDSELFHKYCIPTQTNKYKNNKITKFPLLK
jgi:hypothetical protein